MTTEPLTSLGEPADVCTIIIATLGLAERATSLKRAIRSVRAGNQAQIDVLVIVNGDRFDPNVVESLRSSADIRLLQIETGSLTAAILAGRQHVRSPFFGFLDDDDEYLPGAVDQRLAAMCKHETASVVVTNGFRHVNGKDEIALQKLPLVEQHPLESLFEENWLASCGGLYRSCDLPVELFENIARYLEWTWLAFRISSAGKRIVALDRPTFRIHDTAISESKSDAYRLNLLTALQRMLAESADRSIRGTLRLRIAQTWHDISCEHLHCDRLAKAWHTHLMSLRHPCGWRYLSYTRHLFLASIFQKQ